MQDLEPAGSTQAVLRELQEMLAEHGRLLHSLPRRVDELRRGLAKQAKLIDDAVQGALKDNERSVLSADKTESLARVRSASDIKLDELMAELEKLPPEELRRQIEAANTLLLEEQACQSPS
jgi:hypothetical protein